MTKRAQHQAEATTGAAAPKKPPAFPIVGVGASAGGLEAIEQFLRHVPPHSGMAFVIIQHLDPNHDGMLPALLQRGCAMPVKQVTDRLKVEPDHVYVIPPNKDISLLQGALHLFEQHVSRGLRLPIDFFFRALAEDRQQLSIGVILSGMGSDGTLGLRAIKEKGGLSLVQSPDSAQFDGMPRSAVDAGLADIIATPDQLPGQILAYLSHVGDVGVEPLAKYQGALEKIMILLRTRTGHDFSAYKKTTLYRRIERRMAIHLIKRIGDYVRFLGENSQELDLLFKELLIGVTSFFRDAEVWDRMKTVLQAQLANCPPGKQLRAWVAACSTGEEAYTLAMLFIEALEQLEAPRRLSLQIYATDLDANAIERARHGFYPGNIAADLTPERLSRFFVAEDHGYRIVKLIREMVVFAPQNLISDPPFTKLDLLLCRNLLIYLDIEQQKKLLALFHYSLNPGGTLLLGNAETVGGYTDLFEPIDAKARVYRRNPASAEGRWVGFSQVLERPWPPPEEAPRAPVMNLQAAADHMLLRRYSPSAVLTNREGDILYINGRTGQYLEPASGKANWNIYAMVRDGLRLDLLNAFEKAIREKCAVSIPVSAREGGKPPPNVRLTVELLEAPDPLSGMVIIVFQEVRDTGEGDGKRSSVRRGSRAAELEREIQRLRDQLQATREDMQGSQEELKSANEELQSTNEELQSANEELTTSKEEMQSLNEELRTVNAELQSKLDDLSRASNDMNNLLNATEIATVFLDNALCVRRYTDHAVKVIKLIPGDAGRPLSDLVTDLDYPELYSDAQQVLHSLAISQKEIPTHDGRWFRIRIMPYRTTENVIDGVVITFIDITLAKDLEQQLRHDVEGKG